MRDLPRSMCDPHRFISPHAGGPKRARAQLRRQTRKQGLASRSTAGQDSLPIEIPARVAWGKSVRGQDDQPVLWLVGQTCRLRRIDHDTAHVAAVVGVVSAPAAVADGGFAATAGGFVAVCAGRNAGEQLRLWPVPAARLHVLAGRACRPQEATWLLPPRTQPTRRPRNCR